MSCIVSFAEQWREMSEDEIGIDQIIITVFIEEVKIVSQANDDTIYSIKYHKISDHSSHV